MTRCARRLVAALLQKPLYASVLEGMKRDYRQPTAAHQQLFGCEEPAIELTKLVIDGDAESLEGPSCRVLSRLKFRHRGTHDFGEFDRTSNGPVLPCCGNRARNPAGEAFLAELADQFGQLAFGQGSN